MATPELEAEVLRLRRRISALMDEASHNERLLKKTQQRELELLKTDGLSELFDVICNRLAVSYSLQCVTLVLIDPQHEIRHSLLAAKVQLTAYPRVIFFEKPAKINTWFQLHTHPWLGPYSAPRHDYLFKGAEGSDAGGIKSIALIPLWRQQQLQGCICFGSQDELRFTRQLATDFLSHLGATASFALENTLNRARLVLSGVTDYLTGWHNRRYLEERLKEEFARARRAHTTLACIVLDLDHFKIVNDTYGHLAGDMALCEAAERIKHQTRDSDTAARFGGDEFVVLAPEITKEQALHMAERMRDAVCATPVQLVDGMQHQFTVSVGVAVLSGSLVERHDVKVLSELLFSDADAALYRAKQQGRNRVELVLVKIS
ncbi:MAG: DUF484 family protein [Steroidobacteraceae bacterium]